MKQATQYILAELVFLVFAFHGIAQNMRHNVSIKDRKIVVDTSSIIIKMKTFNKDSANYANYRAKALKDFKKTFKKAVGDQWYEMKDGLRANFMLDHIIYRVDYDKKGNWLHTVRCFDESRLPEDIKQLVTKDYPDYNITLVEEITAFGCMEVYIIHLESEAYWLNIQVNDEEVTELEKHDKY